MVNFLQLLLDLLGFGDTSERPEFDAQAQASAMTNADLITDDQTIPAILDIESETRGKHR